MVSTIRKTSVAFMFCFHPHRGGRPFVVLGAAPIKLLALNLFRATDGHRPAGCQGPNRARTSREPPESLTSKTQLSNAFAGHCVKPNCACFAPNPHLLSNLNRIAVRLSCPPPVPRVTRMSAVEELHCRVSFLTSPLLG